MIDPYFQTYAYKFVHMYLFTCAKYGLMAPFSYISFNVVLGWFEEMVAVSFVPYQAHTMTTSHILQAQHTTFSNLMSIE